ncbi:MAG: recombination mediator RecR [Flavobacteriales bacterium]
MILPSEHLANAVEHIASLPGIGRKTALRLALELLNRPAEEVRHFGQSVIDMKNNVRFCIKCNNVSDKEICDICSNASRDSSTICVVEDMSDVLAIESTGQFSGLYHVLGGIISPMDGKGPADLNIESLKGRVKNEQIEEIILALSTTMEGDTTAFYIFKQFNDAGVKISVLARGVSVGDEIEYTDEITLGRSIINRTPYETTLAR